MTVTSGDAVAMCKAGPETAGEVGEAHLPRRPLAVQVAMWCLCVLTDLTVWFSVRAKRSSLPTTSHLSNHAKEVLGTAAIKATRLQSTQQQH